MSVPARNALGRKLYDLYLCFGFNIYVVLKEHFYNRYITPGYSMVESCIPTEVYRVWISIVGEQYRNTFHIVSLGGLWKLDKEIHLQFKEAKTDVSAIALNSFP